MKKLLISAGVLSASAPLLLSATQPADAATRWTYRSTDLSASADFAFRGTIDGFAGNVHTGNVSATAGRYAEISVVDWTCPDGAWPSYGYGYDGGSNPCTFEDSHDMHGDSGVTVAIDKKLLSGSITGTMTDYTYDGDYYSPPTTTTTDVAISFTGQGATETSTDYTRTKDYVFKNESTTRSAVVSGSVGSIDLGAQQVEGTLSSTKTYERSVS
jgi:hypothetical protein